MMRIQSYLTFNGNCNEAMRFYKNCLGGELKIQKIGDSPLSEQMPEQMKNCILHATLSNEGLVLMGSDMVGKNGLIKGNNVSMVLNCESEKETRERYEKLSDGGEKTHGLEVTFWGALFGDLVDRYGNHWLLNFEKKK
jgi:PhnB protein